MDRYTEAGRLALGGRYREARDSLRTLLESEPSNVEALILLGKVEFYLRHTASSRRCFQTALSYEPDNMAAFFGLEYHRQRARLLALGACVVLVLAAVAGATGFLAYQVSTAARQLDARLEASRTALSGSLDRVLSALEETRTTLRAGQEDADKAFSAVRAELERLGKENEDAAREIRDLRKAVLRGEQPLTAP